MPLAHIGDMRHRYTIHHGQSHLSEMPGECHGHLYHCMSTTLRCACMVLIALRALRLSEAVRGAMLFCKYLSSEVLQSRWKFLGLHQLKGGVDLFEQLGIMYTLRVG